MRQFLKPRCVTMFVVDFFLLGMLLYVVPFSQGILTIITSIPDPFKNILFLLANPWQYHSVMTITLSAVIALLGSLNIMFIAFLKRHSVAQSKMTGPGSVVSVIGFVFAALGLGCVACGSLVISSLLAFVGLGGILFLLPFAGIELLWGGIALLTITAYFLYKRTINPLVCIT